LMKSFQLHCGRGVNSASNRNLLGVMQPVCRAGSLANFMH